MVKPKVAKRKAEVVKPKGDETLHKCGDNVHGKLINTHGEKRKTRGEEESLLEMFQARIDHVELENKFLTERVKSLEEAAQFSRIQADDLRRNLRERTKQLEDANERYRVLKQEFKMISKSHDIILARLQSSRVTGVPTADASLPERWLP
ncbi:hypothetical protein R1sor_009285 [Riccia sorocarpa]|uniref:Uncharacterized protein n=1 Tax=Riccia sorocarpa TaxID=122646 RepID=A0ABD3I0U4_9MARC